MTIAVGQKLPVATFGTMQDGKPEELTTDQVFAGKHVAVFAVPGAYTPTCHLKHLPGFVANAKTFRDKGLDTIACISVNDVFVLGQWCKDTGADGTILMLADGSGDFTRAIGMELDLSGDGLGLRSKRYAMLVRNGVVEALNVEENAGVAVASSAEALLKSL